VGGELTRHLSRLGVRKELEKEWAGRDWEKKPGPMVLRREHFSLEGKGRLEVKGGVLEKGNLGFY